MAGKVRREDIREMIQEARRLWPIGTVMSHYKGGTYLVVGHGIDTERAEANVSYVRKAGPGYCAIMEMGIIYHRPLSLFTKDRFTEIR